MKKKKFTDKELELIEVLKKYGNRGNLIKKNEAVYKRLRRDGMSDILDAALPRLIKNWTLEECKRSALRYQKRGEWLKGDCKSYFAAQSKGWLEECCKHMGPAKDERAKLNEMELKRLHDKGGLPPSRKSPLGRTWVSLKSKKPWKEFPNWKENPKLARSLEKFLKSMPENVKMVEGQKWKGMLWRYKFVDLEYGPFNGEPKSMVQYSFKNGLTGHPKRGYLANNSAKKKRVMRSDGRVFESITVAANALKVVISSVRQSLKKGTKVKGFTFKYAG